MGAADGEASTDGDGTRRYGTIEGVFVPTLLTILGVILYLRTGWVVGNVGVVGAVAIIVVAFTITGLTAVSVASISTNVAPSAGGAYAVIARSFGVEAGGAVGVALYLSQALVIVLYLFGFRDGWLRIFPGHAPLLIDAASVLVLVAITLIGAKTAFRVQYLILAVVVVSLGAVAVAAVSGPYAGTPAAFGDLPGAPEEGFPGTSVWSVFAVFFPATTGIMAGLNMSGELRDPRASILRGTLSAVGVAFVVYLAVAVWLAAAVPTDDLVGDYLAMADRSAWPPAVLAGLLAATFSSALASMVGAPRILHALAEDRVTPAASWLGRRAAGGEPRHALLVTVAVVVAGVLLRDLNAIAPVITMVFLLTYGAINLAVLAEIVVDLPSYRPTFRVPWPVPAAGIVGCFGAMVILNPWVFVGAVVVTVAVLVWVSRRDVARPVADIRSAMLVKLARWATRTARGMRTSDERTWSPRFLVPFGGEEDATRAGRWLPELAEEGDRVRLVPVDDRDDADGGNEPPAVAAARELCRRFEEAGLEVTTPEAAPAGGGRGPVVALTATGDESEPATTDVILAGFPGSAARDRATRRLLRDAFAASVGAILVPDRPPPEGPADGDAIVALWLGERAPLWKLTDHLPHADLALLVAYRLQRSWDADLRLVTAVGAGGPTARAEEYLRTVAERARLPGPPELVVLESPFEAAIGDPAADADVHVFALSSQTDFERWREVADQLEAPCLFVRDSGVENAFA